MKALLAKRPKNGIQRKLGLGLFLALFLSGATGYAQLNMQLDNLSTRKKSSKNNVQKSWTLPLIVERSSTLHAEDSYERQSYSTFLIVPTYRFNNGVRASLSTLIYKEENSVGNSGWDNTSIVLNRSFLLNKNFSSNIGSGVVLPTDQNLRDSTTYQGAVRINGSITRLNILNGSSLTYGIFLSRNFHELEQNSAGAFNIRESATQNINYAQPLTDKVALITSFSYIYSVNYADTSRTKFYVGMDLNWQIRSDLGVYIGTSNEGNALKPNGSDSNIEFYNDNSSIVKVGLNYVI